MMFVEEGDDDLDNENIHPNVPIKKDFNVFLANPDNHLCEG